jgi:hypothetical protein
MRYGPAIPLEDVLEKDWQRDVLTLAKQLGWRVYHTFNSQRSAHGFPDAVMTRRNDRTIYVEFKRERGKLTDEQKSWIADLITAGQEAYVARPRDLDILGRILSSRHRDVGEPLLEQTRQEVGA